MRWRRVLLGSLGLVLVGLAVTGGGPLSTVVQAGVEALGNDYLFVVLLGGVGVLLAAGMLVSGRTGNLEQTETPNPERPPSVPAAGETFDDRVGGLRFALPVVGRSARRDVRARLRAAAVEVTARSDGCSRREAERRVDDGTWTDERAAAAFLATERRTSVLAGQVTALLRGETRGQRRARSAVEEVAARSRRTEGSQ